MPSSGILPSFFSPPARMKAAFLFSIFEMENGLVGCGVYDEEGFEVSLLAASEKQARWSGGA
jgi:hypothetical protein